jgi:hypothetical protein
LARYRVLTVLFPIFQTDSLQIEQFIESVFPSKKPSPKKVSAVEGDKEMSAEERVKLAKQKEEEKWDGIYMGVAVLITLLLITLLMVCGSSMRTLVMSSNEF